MKLPFGLGREKPPTPAPGGRVVYAVGDIHGRADLLERLIGAIDADWARLGEGGAPVLIFLGDYIDRGPASREVVDQVLALEQAGRYQVRALMGNHEATLLEFLGDATLGPSWAEYGGLQTLASYGVAPVLRAQSEAWEEARIALVEALPQSHARFFGRLDLTAEYGDYVFVHAGVRPGVPIGSQVERDLLWIRDDFLGWRGSFGSVVVHGHTPEPEPTLAFNRIGIDTGAYATGVLTAVRLSGPEQIIIQARAGRPS